jgi:hypothetical protein
MRGCTPSQQARGLWAAPPASTRSNITAELQWGAEEQRAAARETRRRHSRQARGLRTAPAPMRNKITAELQWRLRAHHQSTHIAPSEQDTPNHALAHGPPTPQFDDCDHPFPCVLVNSSFKALS